MNYHPQNILDQRFFVSSQGLESSRSFIRLASVLDLLHLIDEYIASSSTPVGRVQEIVDLLIAFIHADDPKRDRWGPTTPARSAAFKGLCARISGPLEGENYHPPSLESWDEFSNNYRINSLSNPIIGPNGEIQLNFSGLNLRSLHISGCYLSGLMWRSASLNYAVFNDCVINVGDFYNADLFSMSFSGSALRCAFDNANLQGVMIKNADMQGSDFTSSDLSTSWLTDSNLTNCCFVGSDLSNADLTGSICNPEVFRGALINEYTTFPDGSKLGEVDESDLRDRWPGIVIRE